MKTIYRMCLVAAVLAVNLSAAPPAKSETPSDTGGWPLPYELNASNTQVSFDVDTTWHRVEGKIGAISGAVRLTNPQDPASVHAEISFPVRSIDTGNHSRDEELMKDMAADKFPVARLELSPGAKFCLPAEVGESASCDMIVSAALEIRGVKKELQIPVSLRRVGSKAVASGKVSFRWADFGIVDPSIFVARVDKTVNVEYAVQLPL